MSETQFDCIVIGSGPGGYVAAIRAAQLGLKTAVVEREAPGGVCLNWGCIPTKALLKSAEVYQLIKHAADFGLTVSDAGFDFPAIIERSRRVVYRMSKGVQFLLKKNKIELLLGKAVLEPGKKVIVTNADSQQTAYQFKKAIIATGARPRALPSWTVDRSRILTSRELLQLKDQPKKLLIIGAGAIGVEFASFYQTFGTEVTLVEMLPNILPLEDEEISQALEKSLRKQGISIKTSTTVESLKREGDTVLARLRSSDAEEEWSGDYALVAIGVQGNVEDLGLEALGIQPQKTFIPVNQFYCTASPEIYAVGDVIGPPLLAHVASHEGVIAAEHLAGNNPHPLDYSIIPGCTYCRPQVASLGLTEKSALQAGKKIRTGRFPFAANGKAVASGETEGFVKVVIDEELEEILGVHLLHAEATELIGEAAVLRAHEGTAASAARTIHAHPTLSEAVMEAMAAALGRAIHI